MWSARSVRVARGIGPWVAVHSRTSRSAALSLVARCSRGMSPSDQRRSGSDTNTVTKFTCTTPPLRAMRRRMESGTLRTWSVSARAEECEKITGASVTSSTALIAAGDTCEMSTIIPSRFISRTTSRPNGESPPCRGMAVAASAQSVLAKCVSVM